MKFLLLTLLFLSHQSFSQDIQTSPPLPTEGSEVVPVEAKPEEKGFEGVVESAQPVSETKTAESKTSESGTSTRENRKDSIGTVMVGYQLVTSWLPSKKTVSYTHIFNEDWSIEGEYSFQKIDSPIIGIDVGEITERRFTLQSRVYFGNSFNFTFGPNYSTFKARVGNSLLSSANVNSEFTAHNIGLTGGMGNRWQWKNGITLGVDWLRLTVPVIETKVEDDILDEIVSSSDQESLKDFIRIFNRIPTFVLFGVNVGYTF